MSNTVVPLRKAPKLLTTEKGKPRTCLANVAAVLADDSRWRGVIALDEFNNRVVKLKAVPGGAEDDQPVWSNEDDSRTAIWITHNYGFAPAAALVTEAVNVVAASNAFHAARSYFETIRWDGERRLDNWLARYLGAAASPYTAAVGAMWTISCVARVICPGAKVDHTLILEGPQAAGKSTALKTLAGEAWFSDQVEDLASKDAAMQLQGRLIVELAELDALSRAEVTRAKAFLTRTHDKFRPPYGRRVVEVPRQCVFAGSTNSSAYLRDATGGRRFWPVRVGTIDLDSLQRDRDQLWAEAVDAYQNGRPWWPDASQADVFAAEQEERFQVDAWETEIAKWMETRLTGEPLTTGLLLRVAIGKEPGQWNRADEMRIADCMKRLGYQQARGYGPNGNRFRFWGPS